MRWLHVLAGLTGLASGAVALAARKGARLHRRSGTVFVYAMLFMSASGAVMAARQDEVIVINVIAGVLTFYLVLTALLTVRGPALESHWSDAVTMAVALIVGVAAFGFGFEALGPVAPGRGDPGAAPYFVFGAVALLAALGDLRTMRARRVVGARRIARHLWRMCFALFVAAGSFFLGQPQVFPPPWRRSGLLALPVLSVLAVMFYWLARVRRRPPRGLAPGHALEPQPSL